MTGENKERNFLDAAKTGFEQSVRNLDANTLLKLARARHTALNMNRKPRTLPVWMVIPAGVAATVCLALLIYILAFRPQTEPAVMADDIELMSSSDSLEFFEELEFYEWLEDDELST